MSARATHFVDSVTGYDYVHVVYQQTQTNIQRTSELCSCCGFGKSLSVTLDGTVIAIAEPSNKRVYIYKVNNLSGYTLESSISQPNDLSIETVELSDDGKLLVV